MDVLQGKTLLQKSGDQVSEVSADEVLQDVKVIGYYFSAHWCPPCRAFTPILAEHYKEMKEAEKSVEIVFVSSDQDEDKMKEYLLECHGDWLCIPFDDDLRQELGEKFEVDGIPTLTIVNNGGEMVSKNGRLDITAKGADAYESWEQGKPAVDDAED